MSTRHLFTLALTLAFTAGAGFHALAGDQDKKISLPPTPLEDGWRFSLASPGWMAGLVGDVGINGVTTHINLDPGDIIRHYDMVAGLRAEAGKGRFGVTAEFLYGSLSDGVGPGTVVKKVDLQVDEFIGDLGLYWRLLEGKRGYLDVIGGVRYVNLYQKVALQPDAQRIAEASTSLVDNAGNRLRSALSESGLRDIIAQEFRGKAAGVARHDDNLYAGKDGNVYRRDDDGWAKYEDGDWEGVDRPERNNPSSQSAGAKRTEAAPRKAGRKTIRRLEATSRWRASRSRRPAVHLAGRSWPPLHDSATFDETRRPHADRAAGDDSAVRTQPSADVMSSLNRESTSRGRGDYQAARQQSVPRDSTSTASSYSGSRSFNSSSTTRGSASGSRGGGGRGGRR